MKPYNIKIEKIKEGVALHLNNEENKITIHFKTSADLDHFIYELKQFSFDFQIVQRHKHKEIEPIDGTEL